MDDLIKSGTTTHVFKIKHVFMKIKHHLNMLKLIGSNPNLDLVHINAHTEFGQTLSIVSQDIC